MPSAYVLPLPLNFLDLLVHVFYFIPVYMYNRAQLISFPASKTIEKRKLDLMTAKVFIMMHITGAILFETEYIICFTKYLSLLFDTVVLVL